MKTKKMDLQRSLEAFREAKESLEFTFVSELEQDEFWNSFSERISNAEKYKDWDKLKSGYFVDEIRNKYISFCGGNQ